MVPWNPYEKSLEAIPSNPPFELHLHIKEGKDVDIRVAKVNNRLDQSDEASHANVMKGHSWSSSSFYPPPGLRLDDKEEQDVPKLEIICKDASLIKRLLQRQRN